MIKLDSDKVENIIVDLFLQSMNIKHVSYNTIEKKMNMFAEFYVYVKFYLDITYKNKISDTLNENSFYEINSKLNTLFVMLKEVDLELVKNLLSLIYNETRTDRRMIDNKILDQYKTLDSSIIRKMKINLLLKKN